VTEGPPRRPPARARRGRAATEAVRAPVPRGRRPSSRWSATAGAAACGSPAARADPRP